MLTQPGPPKMTVVGHGAWCWAPLIAALAEDGVKAEALELPLSSYEDDVATVRDALGDRPDVIVVGHSYGGMVISGAGHRAAHLVFLAAVVPEQGQSSVLAVEGFEPVAPPDAFTFSPDGTSVTINPERAAEGMYGCCDPADVGGYVAQLRPTAMACALGVLETEPAWRTVPSTYVTCPRDRTMPPAAQLAFAARIGVEPVSIDTDHSPMLSRTSDVARLIVDLAKAPVAAG